MSTDHFLNNKLGPADAIAADYTSKIGTLGFTSYVQVVVTGSGTVVEYWMLYAYNNGPLNNHQGDWEVVQVFLDASGSPQKAVYSQHGSGENAAWTDVEKSDTHPVVYVAEGSHANYFRPYQGRIGIENDIVGSSGRTISHTDLNLVVLSNENWLVFPGRWGYSGTDEEMAAGRAGPFGPVFNQNGERWVQPESYLSSTLGVNGNYFILAWLAAYFLLIISSYIGLRAVWKVLGIIRQKKKGGLLVMRFLKSRGLFGLVLGIVAILITVAALFLPWYTITASSQSGPLAQQGGVTLLNVDGINGMQVNLFLGAGGDSSSGFASLFFLQIPFAILIAAGIVLLTLDVIGVRSGKKLGTKFMTGAITSLLPFVFILVFITQLPSFLPFASGLIPGQSIPAELETLVRTIAGQPVSGTASQAFPVIGSTTVNWGFGLGAYLFVVAAVVRIVGGVMVRGTPDLTGEKPAEPKTVSQPPENLPEQQKES